MEECIWLYAVFRKLCLRTQALHLAGGGFGGGSGGREERSQKGSRTSRISATNHRGCVSSGQPVCSPAFLSVCPSACLSLHRQLAVCTTLMFCVLQACRSFHWRAAWEKKACTAVHMLDTGPVARLKREGGNEGGRGPCPLTLRQVETGLCFVASIYSKLALSVAAALPHKSTLTSLLLDFIYTHPAHTLECAQSHIHGITAHAFIFQEADWAKYA